MVQNAVRFDAKCSAFWCKTQGKTVQNAVQFDAKCKAKCRKTQDDKHKYPLKWYKHNLSKPLKTWPKRAK